MKNRENIGNNSRNVHTYTITGTEDGSYEVAVGEIVREGEKEEETADVTISNVELLNGKVINAGSSVRIYYTEHSGSNAEKQDPSASGPYALQGKWNYSDALIVGILKDSDGNYDSVTVRASTEDAARLESAMSNGSELHFANIAETPSVTIDENMASNHTLDPDEEYTAKGMIVDEITFHNLDPNKKYTVTGTITTKKPSAVSTPVSQSVCASVAVILLVCFVFALVWEWRKNKTAGDIERVKIQASVLYDINEKIKDKYMHKKLAKTVTLLQDISDAASAGADKKTRQMVIKLNRFYLPKIEKCVLVYAMLDKDMSKKKIKNRDVAEIKESVGKMIKDFNYELAVIAANTVKT